MNNKNQEIDVPRRAFYNFVSRVTETLGYSWLDIEHRTGIEQTQLKLKGQKYSAPVPKETINEFCEAMGCSPVDIINGDLSNVKPKEQDPTIDQIKHFLKLLNDKKGYNRKNFVRITGISKITIDRIFADKLPKPFYRLIQGMCNGFNCTREDIINGNITKIDRAPAKNAKITVTPAQMSMFLKAIAEQHGYTQTQIRRRCDINIDTMSKLFHGRGKLITDGTINKICKGFNVTRADIISFSNVPITTIYPLAKDFFDSVADPNLNHIFNQLNRHQDIGLRITDRTAKIKFRDYQETRKKEIKLSDPKPKLPQSQQPFGFFLF